MCRLLRLLVMLGIASPTLLFARASSSSDAADSCNRPMALHDGQFYNFWEKAEITSATAFFLAKDNSLWASGRNGYAQNGAVRNGALGAGINNPDTITQRFVRVLIPAGMRFKQMASGNFFGLALGYDGSLWGWGDNIEGQLALPNPDVDTSHELKPVQPNPAKKWKYIAAGHYHSLGIDTQNRLWAWGSDVKWQLGDKDPLRQAKNAPVEIGGNSWMRVAAGAWQSYGLKNDGTIWAWGDGFFGQLGCGDDIRESDSPIQIGTEKDWVTIFANSHHVLALKTDNTLWAWGENRYGQTGQRKSFKVTRPTKVNDMQWRTASAGFTHTLAIATDGSLWSWGNNEAGELGLGDGAGDFIDVPTRVGTKRDWTDVYAGKHVSIAIDVNSQVYVWGSNEYGTLCLPGESAAKAPVLLTFDPAETEEPTRAASFNISAKIGTVVKLGFAGGSGKVKIDYGEGIKTFNVPFLPAEGHTLISFTATKEITPCKVYTGDVTIFSINNSLSESDTAPYTISDLNLSGWTDLSVLELCHVGLSRIDLSGQSRLKELYLARNKELTSIDLGGNPLLSVLHLQGSGLTTLDLSKNNRLRQLYAFGNKLGALDLSHCPELEQVIAYGGTLTSADVHTCKKLSQLWLHGNKLKTLTLGEHPNFSIAYADGDNLYINDNELTEIDLSGCPNLPRLWCQNNRLRTLDLSKQTKLIDLICANNRLQSLTVSPEAETTSPIIIPGNLLDACALNNFFRSLADRHGETKGNTVVLQSGKEMTNPGIATSETKIATQKNWRLIDNKDNSILTGDGTGCTDDALAPVDNTPGLRLYPNPAHDFVRIANIRGEASYSIVSLDGRKQAGGTVCDASSHIYIGALPPGVYLIILDIKSKSLIYSLSKQ